MNIYLLVWRNSITDALLIHLWLEVLIKLERGEHTPEVVSLSCFKFGNLATRSHQYDVSHNLHVSCTMEEICTFLK